MANTVKTQPSRAKKGWKALKSPFKKKSSTSLNSILNGNGSSGYESVNEIPPMPQMGLNYRATAYNYNLTTMDPGHVPERPPTPTMGLNYGTPAYSYNLATGASARVNDVPLMPTVGLNYRMPAYNYNVVTIDPGRITEIPPMPTMGKNYGTHAYNYNYTTIDPGRTIDIPPMPMFGNNNSAPVHNHTTSDPGRVNEVAPMPKTGLNIGGSLSDPTNNYTTKAPAEQNEAGGKGGFKMDASGKLYWDEPDESSSDEEEIDGQFTPGKNVWYREPSTGLEQIVKVISSAETRRGVLYKVEHLLSGEFKKVSGCDLTRRRAGSFDD